MSVQLVWPYPSLLKPWVPNLILKDLIYAISVKIFSAAVKLKALALASSEVAQARLSEGVNSIFKTKIVILGLPETWMMSDELHGASLYIVC